jgi:hypothetical protein
MTKILNRYELDFDKAMEYFTWQMDGGNTLSKELSNILNFKEGVFFTLLPEDARFERLYLFEGGWILPQNPTYDQFDAFGNKTGSYTRIPTLKMEISNLLFVKMRMQTNFACIFEEVMQRLDDPHLDFFYEYGFLYLNELYYVLFNHAASPELLKSAIGESNALWHQLFILTEISNPDFLGKKITLDRMKEICQKTQLLIVRAYDGEGFLFWEPNKTS